MTSQACWAAIGRLRRFWDLGSQHISTLRRRVRHTDAFDPREKALMVIEPWVWGLEGTNRWRTSGISAGLMLVLTKGYADRYDFAALNRT